MFCEIPKLCFYCEALEVNEQHLTTDSSIHQVAVDKIKKKITLDNLSRFSSDLSLAFPDMGTLTLCFADVDFMWVSLFVTEMGVPHQFAGTLRHGEGNDCLDCSWTNVFVLALTIKCHQYIVSPELHVNLMAN